METVASSTTITCSAMAEMGSHAYEPRASRFRNQCIECGTWEPTPWDGCTDPEHKMLVEACFNYQVKVDKLTRQIAESRADLRTILKVTREPFRSTNDYHCAMNRIEELVSVRLRDPETGDLKQ